MTEDKSLKSKAVDGVIWNLVDAIGRKGLVFIIQILLARIIAPNEFGILGMVTVFISIAETIADCGMTNAVIREKTTTQDEYSLVCFVNTGISVFMYILLILCSNIISSYYKESVLIKIIPVIGLVIIFNALVAVPKAIMIKKMLFKKQAIISIVSVSMAGIIALLMARKGYGIWALIANTVLISVFEIILCLILVRWIPSIRFKWQSFHKYFSFGWKVLAASLISAIYENIYSIIIGGRYSAVELGYYSNASKISSTIASSISQVAQKVSFPIMTEIQDSRSTLRIAYGKILRYAAFLCFPTMMGLLAISDVFISGVLGEKWIPAIPYLKMLCIVGMMMPIHRINLNVLYVKGRSDLVLKLEIIKKLIGLTLIGFACITTNTVLQMLYFAILYELIAFLINTHYSELLIGYSAKQQITDLIPILVSTILMGGLVYAINYLPVNWYITLLIQMFTGFTSYILFSRVLTKDLFFETVAIIQSLVKKG